MSREIKFRAWQPHNSLYRKTGMYEVVDLVFYPAYGGGEAFLAKSGEEGRSSEYLEDIKLMQYTGLKDKYGAKIFEGDILKHTGKAYDGSEYTYTYTIPSDFSSVGDDDPGWGYDVEPGEVVNDEIIGNIYENKDLLK